MYSMYRATVDSRNPAPLIRQLIHIDPIVYRVVYITGGAEFLPSAVLIKHHAQKKQKAEKQTSLFELFLKGDVSKKHF